MRLVNTCIRVALNQTKNGLSSALAPKNQFAQDALTLVHFHRGDKDLFIKHVRETIALNPNAPYIVGVAGWHMSLYGHWDEGLALLQKGMMLNPHHPSWFHLVPFMNFYRLSEYENAFAEALKFNYPTLHWDPLMRAAAWARWEGLKRPGPPLQNCSRWCPILPILDNS